MCRSRVQGALRVLIAPDKFKGSLSASEVSAAMRLGVLDAMPSARVTELPFADGGDGTVEVVVAAGGRRLTASVPDPLGRTVVAEWAVLNGAAFVEMAEASGLRYVDPNPTTALESSTAGTGWLIRAAIDGGAERVVVGLGGSATTDGGFGALRALDVRFLTADGSEVTDPADIESIASIDTSAVDARYLRIPIDICADVTSPLAGPRGSAALFGPQKGADAATVDILEGRLAHLARLYTSECSDGAEAARVGGAAGGTAAGLMAVLGARLRSGVDALAELLNLDAELDDADLVIVGEGSMDAQSLYGKTPIGVAAHAEAHDVACIAIVGVSTVPAAELINRGISALWSLSDAAQSREAAIKRAAHYVRQVTADALVHYLSTSTATDG